MKKSILLPIIILAVVTAVVVGYLLLRQKNPESKMNIGVTQPIPVQTADPLGAQPDLNPTTKTNPFKGVKTNPFE